MNESGSANGKGSAFEKERVLDASKRNEVIGHIIWRVVRMGV